MDNFYKQFDNIIFKSIFFFIHHYFFFFCIFLHTLIWLVLIQFIDFHADYLDHWMQSRVYSLSYYEHPPMVAIWIRITTFIFGTSKLGMGLGAWFTNSLVLSFVYFLTTSLYNKQAGIFAVLGLLSTFFFFVEFNFIQTEQPLLLFWLGSLFCLLKYHETQKQYYLLLMGICTGLGALSKYTMVLFYISIFVYFLLVPSKRKEFVNPWQCVGGIIALFIFSPVIYWNATHEWISFKFQFMKGGNENELPFGLVSLGFLLATLISYSFILMTWGIKRMYIAKKMFIKNKTSFKESHDFLLIMMAITPILFFALLLFNSDYLDPKWAVLGVMSFFIWLGGETSKLWNANKKKCIFTLHITAYLTHIICISIFLIHIIHPLIEIEPRKDPADQIVGWRELVQKSEQFLHDHKISLPKYVVSVEYPLSAHFGFHLSNQPTSYSLGRIRRNLWSDPRKMNQQNTLFVCIHLCKELEERAKKRIGFIIQQVGSVTIKLRGNSRQVKLYQIIKKDMNFLDKKEMDPRLQTTREK